MITDSLPRILNRRQPSKQAGVVRGGLGGDGSLILELGFGGLGRDLLHLYVGFRVASSGAVVYLRSCRIFSKNSNGTNEATTLGLWPASGLILCSV